MSSVKTLLQIENISKAYSLGGTNVKVLDNISTTFLEGCFTVIAGPSGSGKSTLLNILGCLDRPDSGKYAIENILVNYKDKKEMSKIRKNNFGFVFQSFNLIPVLTAQENVELPMNLHSFSAKEIAEASKEILELVGLGDKLNNKPAQLSGGQQQRVAIARAIASKPKIVFADEPTANLDRKNAENIIALMKNLNKKYNVSFIIASHDDAVINAADELLSIEDGQLKKTIKRNKSVSNHKNYAVLK